MRHVSMWCLFALAGSLACSGNGGSSGEPGGQGSTATGGGNSGGTGTGGYDMTLRDYEERFVTPRGSDSSAGICGEVTCGSSVFDRKWKLISRCDATGTWIDPECSEASFAWTLKSAEGGLDFVSGTGWDVSTVTDWTIKYPASCGGCEPLLEGELGGPFVSFPKLLNSKWESLNCSESAGTCECTGTLSRHETYPGIIVRSGEGAGVVIQEPYDPAYFWTQKEHFFMPCADEAHLSVLDENDGAYYFEEILD